MKTKAAVCRAWAEPLTIEELELESPKEKGKCLSRWPTPATAIPTRAAGRGPMAWIFCPLWLVTKRPAWWRRSVPGSLTLQPGDHVVSCWQAPCGKCESCVSGNTHICDNLT